MAVVHVRSNSIAAWFKGFTRTGNSWHDSQCKWWRFSPNRYIFPFQARQTRQQQTIHMLENDNADWPTTRNRAGSQDANDDPNMTRTAFFCAAHEPCTFGQDAPK